MSLYKTLLFRLYITKHLGYVLYIIMGTPTKELARKLEEIALSRDGFFTAAQAVSIGYADSVHGYHVRNGDWERVGRGIYRLKGSPPSKWHALFVFLFWSRGKDGAPQGVFCRDTALLLHGCSRGSSDSVHITVPPEFRRNTPIPKNLRLYRETMEHDESEKINGLPVTTIAKTMSDIGSADINPKILAQQRPADSRNSLSPSLMQPGEWSPGLSFLQALERGED